MPMIDYTCNVCGTQNRRERSELTREASSCTRCKSSVRMRGMVHLVSMHLFGQSLCLDDFPYRPDLVGLGLSDWLAYAKPLAKRLRYVNTFYHRSPLLDITAVPPARHGTCDFVISSDVFEHVAPPVQAAFDGAHRLLKPGGALVLSVPFMHDQPHTLEHFPSLHKFKVVKRFWRKPRLKNALPNGQVEWFDELIFHGGGGSTLELRLFALDAIKQHLLAAGFKTVQVRDEDHLPSGICWLHPWSTPIVAIA